MTPGDLLKVRPLEQHDDMGPHELVQLLLGAIVLASAWAAICWLFA